MIPTGTLCLIVRDHGMAGHTCIVVKHVVDGVHWHADGRHEIGPGYLIAPNCAPTIPGHPRNQLPTGARARHLIPLAPPAPVDSHEREAETC